MATKKAVATSAQVTRTTARRTSAKTAVATWTKLKSGRWGIRLPGTAPAGDNPVVTVTKRDGSTAQVVLGRCLWQGADVSLWTAEAVVGQPERKATKTAGKTKGAVAGKPKVRTRKAA